MFQALRADYKHVPYLSQAALIAANLIPLAGVLIFGWQITTLLAVYWAETGVIGVYSLAKIMTADASSQKDGTSKIFTGYKLLLAVFFCFHFGVFMFVHGTFLFMFFAETTTVAAFNFSGVLLAVVGLFVSHGLSFYRNYWQESEYQALTPKRLMSQPYKRIMVMHFVIILGAFAMAYVGSFQVAALALLVILKTVVDLWSHVHEHTVVA